MKIDDDKIVINATSANTVVASNQNSKRTLILPKKVFISAMARSLKDYKEFPPIIPMNFINNYYLIDEKELKFDLKEYYKWGQEGHNKKLFGESHSSFKAVHNAGGIVKKIDFSGGKTLALRFLTPMMGTRTIIMGFIGKEEIDTDLFFAYLTSSLFLLDALEKGRARRAEFTLINQIDFYLIYHFPDFPNIKRYAEKVDKILSASEKYNGSVALKDRPRFPDLIQQVRANKQHPLRKLDEAWFEALDIPITFIDTLYLEVEERLSDIVQKKETDKEKPNIVKPLGGQQKLF